jgi:hypothetical protein
MKSSRRGVAILGVLAVALAACGDDDDTAQGTTAEATAATAEQSPASVSGGQPPATEAVASTTPAPTGDEGTQPAGTGAGGTAPGATDGTAAGGVSLAGVCPDPLVIQTDWFPEAEHGALFELLGDDYTVDSDAKKVSGPLVAGGQATGIDIEIRAGGPAIGGTVAVTTYSDDSITLAYQNTEGQVLHFADTPLVSVVAPTEINPMTIIWDPETYPDVHTLADLGEQNITINVFGGGVFPQVFVGQGIWSADQVDPSYDGTPARFIAEDGAIAQQGFASAEPYKYEVEFEEWGRPVAYQLLHDAGFQAYSQTVAARADELETLAPCLEVFVPIVQQAAIDFINAPDRANAIILDTVEQYDTFWTQSQGLVDYSVETQRELGLVGNGPDDTLGNMDEARIQSVIDQMRDDAGLDVPEDLVASDLFTNEFVDESIGF